MLKPAEIYKGIAFVRISQLPAEQKEKIRNSIKHDQIIKILIGNALADDCVQYHHYKLWFTETFAPPVISSTSTKTTRTPSLTKTN